MANKVTLIPQRDISKHLAKDDKVQAHLKAHAQKITARARGLLAQHRDTGSHSIKYEGHTTDNFGHIDHYVVMDGPAPVSVEFGHMAENGRWVMGLYILTIASGIYGT
jgi:hypothetical protein